MLEMMLVEDEDKRSSINDLYLFIASNNQLADHLIISRVYTAPIHSIRDT